MLVIIQYFSINFKLNSLLVYLALPEIYLAGLAFCAIENNRLILGLGLPRAFFGLGVLVKWFLSCCSSILNRSCSFIASLPWRILSRRWSRDSCSAEWRISVGRLSSWLNRFWKVNKLFSHEQIKTLNWLPGLDCWSNKSSQLASSSWWTRRFWSSQQTMFCIDGG